MYVNIKSLVEIVHDNGSFMKLDSIDGGFAVGETYQNRGKDIVRKVDVKEDGEVHITFLDRHYADLIARTSSIIDQRDVIIRVHLKKLYEYHFGQGGKNATNDFCNRFDNDIESLVIKSPEIYVVDKGDYYEPLYWSIQQHINTVLTI